MGSRTAVPTSGSASTPVGTDAIAEASGSPPALDPLIKDLDLEQDLLLFGLRYSLGYPFFRYETGYWLSNGLCNGWGG